LKNAILLLLSFIGVDSLEEAVYLSFFFEKAFVGSFFSPLHQIVFTLQGKLTLPFTPVDADANNAFESSRSSGRFSSNSFPRKFSPAPFLFQL